MQELLFPELTEDLNDPFDGFTVLICDPLQVALDDSDEFVCFFEKQDANGKKIYLVGKRALVRTPHGVRYQLHDVKEFKHSFYRADNDYRERLDGSRL